VASVAERLYQREQACHKADQVQTTGVPQVHVRTAVVQGSGLRLLEQNTKTGSIHGRVGPRVGGNVGEVMQFGIIMHELTACGGGGHSLAAVLLWCY
jgi:hypothetical protein